MYFDDSIRGLKKGSPVEFRGIEVGQVLNIDLTLNHETLEVRTPVLVELHPETIIPTGEVSSSIEVVNAWFERGLRAQLSSSNLLTGQLFIDLEFHDNVAPYESTTVDRITVFPTVPAPFDRLAQSATDLLEEVSQLPLKEIADELHLALQSVNAALEPGRSGNAMGNLNKTLKNLNTLSANLNRTIPQLGSRMNQSLTKLERTLDGSNRLLSDESEVLYEFRELLRSMSDAAKSVESLTNYLERNPNSLLYGKPGN